MFTTNPSPGCDPCGDAHRRAMLDGLGDALDWAYGGLSRSRSRHAHRPVGHKCLSLSETLADPIVQALMAADGTDRDRVTAMMRGVAARLASRNPAARPGGVKNGRGR